LRRRRRRLFFLPAPAANWQAPDPRQASPLD